MNAADRKTGERADDRQHGKQRRVLAIVLALNLFLALALGVGGWWADSSALIANALDNTSDAIVYGISLFAIGRGQAWKALAAKWSAVLLLLFAAGVVADTLRRLLVGSEPIGLTMMAMAAGSAIINLVCLFLLRRLDADDVNLEAAETFSFNDFVSNGGVLIAGAMVLWLGQRWPDLLVGLAVAAIALKGGLDIWRSASKSDQSA